MKANLIYKLNEPLSINEARQLYEQSNLAGKRPIYADTIMQMLKFANLIITAWDDDKLVGILRTMTDFCYIAYIVDLAVHKQYKEHNIDKQLICETQAQLAPYCRIVIIAGTSEAKYYNSIGFSEYKFTYATTAERFP